MTSSTCHKSTEINTIAFPSKQTRGRHKKYRKNINMSIASPARPTRLPPVQLSLHQTIDPPSNTPVTSALLHSVSTSPDFRPNSPSSDATAVTKASFRSTGATVSPRRPRKRSVLKSKKRVEVRPGYLAIWN